MDYVLYTDGCCLEERGLYGKCSWAFLLLDNKGNIIAEDSGVEKRTTENRMKLMSIMYGCDHIQTGSGKKKPHVIVYSDSMYAVNVYKKVWNAKANLDIINYHFKNNGKRLDIEYKWLEYYLRGSLYDNLKESCILAGENKSVKITHHSTISYIIEVHVIVNKNGHFVGEFKVIKNKVTIMTDKVETFFPTASQVAFLTAKTALELIPAYENVHLKFYQKVIGSGTVKDISVDQYTIKTFASLYGDRDNLKIDIL